MAKSSYCVYTVRDVGCSVDNVKRSNGVFAKVWRLAAMQLLKHKCLPILLYALEVCNLDRKTMQPQDFTPNRFFMKLFKTSNLEIV